MKISATTEKLRNKAKPVTTDVTEFCKEFKQFVLTHSCMSMTAPQVGYKYCIMAVKYRRTKRVYVMVNPAIKCASKKMVTSKERTLDAQKSVTLTKQRPIWVIFTYQTPNLKHTRQKVFLNRKAAAAMHAYEILNGTLR